MVSASEIVSWFQEVRDGLLEKLWGGGGGAGGRSTKKNSCKGKLSEKKFMHAE